METPSDVTVVPSKWPPEAAGIIPVMRRMISSAGALTVTCRVMGVPGDAMG
ncbi:MAG: hypothetical protein LBD70_00280 [Bifidobacteriaceae bacterium]|nr:hypothetical protein [Bifidobacteriaceae bacterium]